VILAGAASGDQVLVAGAGTSIGVDGLPVQVTIDGVEGANDSLVINTLDGDDTINASGLPAVQVHLVIDGGAGNDTIIGSDGNDTLFGGDGNDLVVGGRGNDAAFLGAGDDTFVWNPGDASDTVDGQAGLDTLQFNGSNANESIDISANGTRALLSRDVAAVTMDLNGIEHIRVEALGGTDTLTVNDLTGTDVKQVAIDLAGTPGGTVGDGQLDAVTVNATGGGDNITVTGGGTVVAVDGLSAQVTIDHADATDHLTINGLAGNDTIDASGLPADRMSVTINGGAGNDIIVGSHGDDTVFGGTGNDIAQLGDGNDLFVWNPGDGSDIVEGQAGFDTLQFNGANIGENIDFSANGERVRMFRDVGNVTMDLNGVENINLVALGGADNITVNDLTGTDASAINIDLAAQPGGTIGDGQVDTVIINGTNGADAITVVNNNGVVTVSGLAADVTISGFEATDRIVINGLNGDDVITASGLGSAMQLTANGGDGADVLIGGTGNDTLSGGNGDDILIGGGGLDILDGGPGDNILIQGLAAPTQLHASHFLLG
jgi:Ca2+-binding RTX toxin-like protein